MRARYRLRQIVNVVNTSTLLGLLVAVLGRAQITRGPDGLLLARGYRRAVPPRRAPAFTLGNVVMLRADEDAPVRRPGLLTHEARHATQYAWCLGPAMVLLYFLASAWSWLRCGDFASRNVFERRAGLALGGYKERPLRSRRGQF